jgi:hypothetical protein
MAGGEVFFFFAFYCWWYFAKAEQIRALALFSCFVALFFIITLVWHHGMIWFADYEGQPARVSLPG